MHFLPLAFPFPPPPPRLLFPGGNLLFGRLAWPTIQRPCLEFTTLFPFPPAPRFPRRLVSCIFKQPFVKRVSSTHQIFSVCATNCMNTKKKVSPQIIINMEAINIKATKI